MLFTRQSDFNHVGMLKHACRVQFVVIITILIFLREELQ